MIQNREKIGKNQFLGPS